MENLPLNVNQQEVLDQNLKRNPLKGKIVIEKRCCSLGHEHTTVNFKDLTGYKGRVLTSQE